MKTEEKNLTGYPSIDKPWLKYYSEEAINAKLPECTLYEYMYENNKDYQDQHAIDYFGRKITYGELFSDIDGVATSFAAIGVKSDDVVTIVSLSCVTSILCFYALNKIGAVSNFVNVMAIQTDLETYIKDADSKIVVSLDLFSEKVLKVIKAVGAKKLIVYSLREYMPVAIKIGFDFKLRKFDNKFLVDSQVMQWSEFIEAGKGQKPILYKKDPHKVCCFGHTGGTTGFPKTVLIDDLGMNAVAHQYNLCFERKRGQVFLNCIIPFVIYGILICMHMPLSLGLCLAVIPKYDAKDWRKYIKKYNPSFLATIPSYVLPMLENKELGNIDLSDFELVAVGGDGMNDILENDINEFFKQHGCNRQILKGYGLSEVCATAITGFNGINKIGSVGIPLVKNNIKIYDNERHEELGYGEVGEICLSCPSRMIGYKDNEDEMKKLFRIHKDNKEWLHTGDLGYVDNDGFLFIVGRMKRIILIEKDGIGHKVYPNIPEKAIKTHEAVSEICNVSVKESSKQVLKAFIVLNEQWKDRAKEAEAQLRRLCENELSDYSRPTYYEFIDKMPLTAVGKVDYRKLEENGKTN